MVDFYNEIFTKFKTSIGDDCKVGGEYTRTPTVFPYMTLEEISNTDVRELMDNSAEGEFSRVQYRLQVFSNNTTGKKIECRGLFNEADKILQNMGFRRISFMTNPDVYNSTIYQISATYESIISSQGQLYRRYA